MLDRWRLTWKMLSLLPVLVRYRPGGRHLATDWIERRAREHGDRIFARFEGRTMTWAALDAEANRLASWAGRQGFAPRSAVALLMHNRPEYISTWAGLAKRGVVTALINTNLTGEPLAHAIRAGRAQALIVGVECLPQLESAIGLLGEGFPIWVRGDGDRPAELRGAARDLDDALAGEPVDPPDPSVRGDLRSGDDLFYIYTSGTTGLPKAARFSHLRFLGIGAFVRWATELGPEDVHYCVLPLYHTAGGAMVVSGVLASGATLVLRRRFSASAFWDDVRESGATCFQYIGELCRYLLHQPERPNDGQHGVTRIIGNGLRAEVWEPFQRRFRIPRIVEFYGATEGNAVLVNLENRVGSVGRVPFEWLSNVRLIRYDPETDSHPRDARGFCIPCKRGEAGELISRIPASRRVSVGRFEGYTSPDETERKILRNVFRRGDAWFRSGDLLRQDEERYYYFVDRIGDTFRWKGENVSTQEVEAVLSGFPGVDVVVVYGVTVEGAEGRAGMAALRLHRDAEFDPGAFWSFCRDRLPAYAIPVFVRIVPDIEVTGTFKLRKVDLQREGYDLARVRDPLFVRDDAGETYVLLTAEILDSIRAGRLRL